MRASARAGGAVEPRRPVLGHRPALTGVRGLAAIMVVCHHVGVTMRQSGPFAVQAHGGYLGVEIFFVLSGFLITTGLLERAETGTLGLRDFYRRRVLRLGPALAALLVLWSSYLVATGFSGRRIAQSAVVVASYTTNFYKNADRDVAPGLGHLWTLAIEEQFYLIWPLVLAVLLARQVRTRMVLAGLGVALVAVTVSRALAFGSSDSLFDSYFRTDTHCDGLLWGAALSVLWRSGHLDPARLRVPAALAALGLFAIAFGPAIDPEPAMRGASLTGFALLSCVALAGLLERDWWLGRHLSSPVWTYLGDRSYAIYLWHVPVLFVMATRYSAPAEQQAVLVLVGTLAMAELSWWLVERPVAARARRLPAARPPLRQTRPLIAQRGVGSVTRVDPGLIGQPAEQLRLDVVDQRGEVVGVLERVPDPPGEQAITGEQVRVT